MNKLKFEKPITVANLVAAFPDSANIVGNPTRFIRCVAPLERLCPGALAFSKTPITELAPALAAAGDVVIIAPYKVQRSADFDFAGVTLIEVAEPRAYFIRALNYLSGGEVQPAAGISSAASIAPDAKIGVGVHIGAGVWVGSRAVIGDGCVLFGGVQVYDDVELGSGCVVQANATIGTHGQAYVRDEAGRMCVMPHFGRVLIGARCRIGAGAVVVRGTLRDTLVDIDTSVGNLANIGHNVEIGARCFIGPGVLLAGSSVVGDDTWVSIGAIVRGAVIGKNVMVGAGAVVTRAVADGLTVNGLPARVTAAET